MAQLVYYLLVIIFACSVFLIGFFSIKKLQKVFLRWLKVFSLALAVFFILRYMWADDALSTLFALEGVFSQKALNFFALLLVWFTFSSNILLTLYGFFSVKNLDNYVKFISLPITVLNLLFLNFHFSAIMGLGSANVFSIRGIWFAIEIGIALGYALLVLVVKTDWKRSNSKKAKKSRTPLLTEEERILEKYYQKRTQRMTNKGFWGKVNAFFIKLGYDISAVFRRIGILFKRYWFGVFAIIVLLLSTMPSYALQGMFGFVTQVHKAKNFEIPHRIILYIALVLPIVIHYSLKNKEFKEKKFYLLFICLGTLLTYSMTKRFAAFLDPTLWPLHLCNTAMYIMPVVLIFNMKRFFYFTYFINVLGAFFAMLMPNYGSSLNMFDASLVNFYVNHFIAFFMPILFVSLGMFERPKFKQFVYSMLGFAGYFAIVIVVNSMFTGLFEAGRVARTTDFFFVNSDFIADKLGNWAVRLRDVVVSIPVGGIKMTFYPVYQVLFFVVYILLGLAVWFVYENGYQIAEELADISKRKQKIRLEELALMSKLNGRGLDEPMNPKNKNKLILRDFTKRYGNSKVLAVDKANLEVHGGEIFGFLGPNGAGKSTIIKSIVGIQPITDGEIEVCGYDVATQSIEAKKCIGFVPDHYALYEKLTGREYINYIADLYNVPIDERNERIDKYVKKFKLQESFDNQMKTYSHGMKQKIAIMAALVHDPKVWILDEPLTGLDPNSIYQVKECMKERAKDGNIVFFSSHIIDVVERICDRIAIIKKGHVLLTEKIKDIEKSGVALEDFYLNAIEGEDSNPSPDEYVKEDDEK